MSKDRIDPAAVIVTIAVIIFAWAISSPLPSLPSQSQLPKPSISISIPMFSTINHEFVARVDALRCTPTAIDWKLPPACKSSAKIGNRSIISCSATGYQSIAAIARGGGCNKATSSTSILISEIGGVTVTFPCDRDPNLPAHIVIPPSGLDRWYYAPSAVSTGRLGTTLSREQTVTLGCESNQ